MENNLGTAETSQNPCLRVCGLTKGYVRGGLWHRRRPVTAVSRVDFEIPAGGTLALVGESGSGKSTVARCVAALEKPDSGDIWIGETEITTNRSAELLPIRSQIQMVFQDPTTSMNWRFTAAEIVEEPLLLQGKGRALRRQLAEAAIREVGIAPEWLNRPARQFSGGQRQRLAIARALVVRPKLLVLDEALTGLDVSTQAQIANLLLDVQAAHSLSFLLISHDLSLVARLANVVAVMSAGRIVEIAPVKKLMAAPKHEKTARLLAAARRAQANLAAFTGASA